MSLCINCAHLKSNTNRSLFNEYFDFKLAAEMVAFSVLPFNNPLIAFLEDGLYLYYHRCVIDVYIQCDF